MQYIDQRWRKRFNVEPVCAVTRRKARIYMRWFDHEILRLVWTNQQEIAPGVFRSNQPKEGRLERLSKAGLVSVLTLRGNGSSAPYFTERQICDRLGLQLHAIGLNARRAPPPATVLALIEMFRTIERPFLMHCKSGADRAGLAAAIYLMAIEGESVHTARRMLSLRYGHFRWSWTGVLDRMLEAYANDRSGLAFEAWVRLRYDPTDIA